MIGGILFASPRVIVISLIVKLFDVLYKSGRLTKITTARRYYFCRV
ncbi:MAG: hypothetical protein ACSLEL_00255 [Candidatus Malihini olakiniferum]